MTDDEAIAIGLDGNRMQSEGKFREAVACHMKLLEHNPSNFGAAFNIAVCYINLEQYQLAIDYAMKAIANNPRWAQAFHVLGSAYHELENYVMAERSYKMCLYLDPQSEDARISLCHLHAQKNEVGYALRMGREAVELNPKNFAAWLNLGNAYLPQGDYHEAIKCYREGIKCGGEMASAIHSNLIFTMDLCGDFSMKDLHDERRMWDMMWAQKYLPNIKSGNAVSGDFDMCVSTHLTNAFICE
jgi:tetratricopeptide (TPR) repeat protein